MKTQVTFQNPPMGWNSWYCFSEGVSDERIRRMADAMVATGLAEHGWNYINIDDCWQGKRGGKYNALQGNERFPDMKALGEYIHARGLKFGIYTSPQIGTPGGFRGSSDDGREELDAMPLAERSQPEQLYGAWPGGRDRNVFRVGKNWLFENDLAQWIEWGVDYIKADWGLVDPPTVQRISQAIRASGKEIMLSLSSAADLKNADFISRNAELWRISRDISDSWECISYIAFDLAPRWMAYASPGHWNDLDMLQIGNIGIPSTKNEVSTKSRLTFEEQKTQFVAWSMYSAPLLLSCDLREIDAQTLELLTNDHIIAIDQDPLCAQPEITRSANGILCYRKKLIDGKSAVAFFNLSDKPQDFEIEIDGTDLFLGESGTFRRASLPPHGCQVFKLQSEKLERNNMCDANIMAVV